jgi:hypothetical protein
MTYQAPAVGRLPRRPADVQEHGADLAAGQHALPTALVTFLMRDHVGS